MMSNNKILTVSYGTFSCTLEGFDDSFDTMKAIAEYFRDLAADDRYFGAEPPQPDAEMLARIAEREIARRVEAHLGEDGVHLRAGDATHALASPVTSGVERSVASPDDAGASGTAEKAVARDDAANEPTAEAELTGSAAENPCVRNPEDATVGLDAPASEDGAAEDAARFFAEGVKDTGVDLPVANIIPMRRAKPAPNSIADKLQRIRAVVSSTHEPQTAYSEDEHAEAFLDEEAAETRFAMPEFFSAHADQDAEQTAAPETADDATRLAPADPDARTDEVADPENFEEDAAALPAGAGPEDDAARTEAVDSDAELAAALARLKEEFDAPGGAQNGDTIDAELAAAPAIRARVIRVKRTALEAALNAGMLEKAEAEAEADLARDDAGRGEAVGPGDADVTEGDANPAEAGQDEEPATASAADLLADAADQEDELDRLMAEADSQMDEPVSSSRRAEFDQMRGVVAATRHDDELGAEGEADEDQYRTDLAAVTPRRPVAGGGTDRPRDQRPAPLKLVAEQRIDIPSMTGPVRPRRVATDSPAQGGDDDGFADYAAARGAHDLPELLEAAAAYLRFVEGRDQFTRPQLMTKVRQIDPDRFSREDGLRQFGKLLRSGKIEKIEGGRFAVCDGIGFRPDGERAAG